VRADAHKRPSTAKQRARQEEAIVLANLEWASIDWYRLTKPEPIALPAPMIDGMEYGWVAPDGSAYACSYRGHAELQWALECHEGVENLEHAGWAALRSTCTGDGMPAWDLPDHPTASQIGTILEWSHQRGIAPPAGIDDPQHADTMLNPLVRRKRRPGERPDGD
jgi:hypothetical protein